MEKVFKKISFVFLLIIISLLSVVSISNFAPRQKVFAEEDDLNITSTTEITNDGTIFDPTLWRALKRFYVEVSAGYPELQDRIYQNEDGFDFFYPDLFKDFPNIVLDLSGKEIVSVENLRCMDFTSFEEIDFSNNLITDIGSEFSKLSSLTKLNLSNNKISSFSYESLHLTSYSQNLTELNISSNYISFCDLSKIAVARIDARFNFITKNSLTLPENEALVVELSHNLIDAPDTTNSNISYGFQGVKDDAKFLRGQKIYLYSLPEISQVEVYSLQVDEENTTEEQAVFIETLIETLNPNDSYEFNYGYYRIKFVGPDQNDLLCKEISMFYICPPAPTIKMYLDGKELDALENQFSSPMLIKFFGIENATFIYKVNNDEEKIGTEVLINTPGVNILRVCQVVDDYISQEYQIYLIYDAPVTVGWLYIIGGTGIFVLLFYLAIRSIPMLSRMNIGKNDDKNNTNLD